MRIQQHREKEVFEAIGYNASDEPIMEMEITPREWESGFFNKNIWFMKYDIFKRQGYKSDLNNIEECFHAMGIGVKELAIDIIYSRIQGGDQAGIHALESLGFQSISNLITFQLDLQKHQLPKSSIIVRPWEIDDLPVLEPMASSSFRYDRFHSDPILSNNKADMLKMEWMVNACKGLADKVLVAEVNGKCVGFMSLKIRDDIGIIDLWAVERSHKGKGIGTNFIYGSVDWLPSKVKKIHVGTQLTNIPAINTYIKCGFRVLKSQQTMRKIMKY